MLNTVRGIRNNNPGNIVRDGTPWQGLAAAQDDPRFCVFTSAQYGIRALAKVLLSYKREGVNTIATIIAKYAPASDNNDTVAYIHNVCEWSGVKDPNVVVDVDNYSVMHALVVAIITKENGECPYNEATLAEGIRMAGVVDAPKPALTKQPRFMATAGAAITATGAAIAQYSAPVQSAATTLHQFDAPLIQKIAVGLTTVAGLLCLLGLLLHVQHEGAT